MRNLLFGLALVASVAGTIVLMVAERQPDVLHVERTVLIPGAEPQDVYPLAVDLTAYKTWDPWSKKDPAQVTTFSEDPVGVGAWMAWEGNEEVGRGKMTVAEVAPDAKVVSSLEFYEPWEAVATSTLTIAPHDTGAQVTWAMDQPQDFGSKLFTTFVDMDGMLGPDFEAGLQGLKDKAQAAAKERIAAEKAAEEEALAEAAAVEAAAMEPGSPE